MEVNDSNPSVKSNIYTHTCMFTFIYIYHHSPPHIQNIHTHIYVYIHLPPFTPSSHAGAEYETRLGHFRKNMQTVNTMNKQSNNGVVYAPNHLMHLSQDEMKALRGYVPAALNEEEVRTGVYMYGGRG